LSELRRLLHGQTKRKEKKEKRLKEHKNDIKKHESNLSVVTKHKLTHKYEFDWLNEAYHFI